MIANLLGAQTLAIKKKRLLDLFVISNYAFLSVDILYAHSVNRFAHKAEYLPLAFSIVAATVLAAGLLLPSRTKEFLSSAIGAASMVIGALGIYFHLESQFFKAMTLASLTFTAPLVAPLAYTALGLLLFLNRFVSSSGRGWGAWVYALAYLGFAGNFVLCLFDHYQNQFFYRTEWIPVVASAAVVGIGPFYLFAIRKPGIDWATRGLVAVQIAVGLVGFALHLYGVVMHGNNAKVLDRILYGPPLLAPLLFVNLALLMAIGMKSMNEPEKLLRIRIAMPS